MKRILLSLTTAAAVCAAPLFAQDTDTETAAGGSDEELRSKVEAMNESMLEMKSTLDALKKLKISGYVQAQYQMADTTGNAVYPVGGTSGGTFPNGVDNRFMVRRGRLKATYKEDFSTFVLQIDATQKGVEIKDAYASITDPWLRSFSLTAGIFNRPFGFEIGYSSSQRETPERARAIQTLFPGERDLGVQLGVSFEEEESALRFFNLRAGVFNGVRGDANENDNYKDIIGRLGVELPFPDAGLAIDAGTSVYAGKVTSRSPVVYEIGTVNGATVFVRDSSQANLNAGFDRMYVGGDLQLYYDLPVIGGFSLRGEYVTGEQPSSAKSASFYNPSGADSLFLRNVSGYYITYVQNVGLVNQFVLKYDVFDPNTDAEGSDIGRAGNLLSVADIRYSTLGLGWIYHWNAHVKFTAYYEMISNEKVNAAATGSLAPYTDDVDDNVFTLRMQYKF